MPRGVVVASSELPSAMLTCCAHKTQRPQHCAKGALCVDAGVDCVYTEVCVDTDLGTFVATAATPRALLASTVASCLSTDEMAILTALNAGMPRDLRQGQPRGYRMYQLGHFHTCSCS